MIPQFSSPSQRLHCSARCPAMLPKRRTGETHSLSWLSRSVARSRTGRGRCLWERCPLGLSRLYPITTMTMTSMTMSAVPPTAQVHRQTALFPSKDTHSSSNNPTSTINAHNVMQWFRQHSGLKPDVENSYVPLPSQMGDPNTSSRLSNVPMAVQCEHLLKELRTRYVLSACD